MNCLSLFSKKGFVSWGTAESYLTPEKLKLVKLKWEKVTFYNESFHNKKSFTASFHV